MSFVSAVASPQFIMVATDGRAERDGKVINENCDKMQVINSKLLIAYTGVKEACEDAIEQSRAFINKTSNISDIGNYIYDLLNSGKYNGIRVSLIIAGINERGQNQLVAINNTQQKTNSIVQFPGQLAYAFSGTDKMQTSKFSEASNKFSQLLSNATSPTEIEKAQVWLNNQVASFDTSVNTNVKFQRLFT